MIPRLLSLSLLLGPLLVACASTRPAAPATADTTRRPAPSAPGLSAEELRRYRPTFPAPAAGATASATEPTKPAAALRPAAPPPTNDVNVVLDQRLRDQGAANANIKYASGYRVRAYLGLEREQVMSIRRQLIARYPDETDYITFKQPVYRLYIGDYLTRLDAARGLARVRQFAPRAELEAMSVLIDKNR